jgi:hypothetical protein
VSGGLIIALRKETVDEHPLHRRNICRRSHTSENCTALYLAFLAVMAFAYQTREMIIPMAIFVIYIAMAFGVPALWVRMKPDHPGNTLGWAEYSRNGISTFTGVMSARDATAQVLMLPVLILGWGIAIAIITSAVR